MANNIEIHAVLLHGQDGKTESIILHGPVIQIGRGAGNDVEFRDNRVSSIHGRIFLDGHDLVYQDLGSTNGSALIREGRGHKISQDGKGSINLEEGDEIKLGDAERPSSIFFKKIIRSFSQSGEVTIIAKRALGELEGIPPADAFRKLLKLLASLRTEDSLLSLTRQVLEFCLQTISGSCSAECFMRTSEGAYECTFSSTTGGGSNTGKLPSSALMQRISSTKESLLVDDLKTASSPSLSMQAMTERSLLLAPLIIDGVVVGALQIGSEDGNRFNAQDLDLLSVLAQQLSSVLEGSREIRRLKETQKSLKGQCDYLKNKLGQRPAMDEMIGKSAAMTKVKNQIRAVAPSKTMVLIQGETGSGKELVARALHENSPRADKTFAAVNCCALSPGLLESELFGHVKGAFTGAHRSRKGLFEVAHGGTLFLDEIGDMPQSLQPKLLRVLEQGSITPVGSGREKKIDVRVITATHRDLEEEVKRGNFRQDLLFRLNVFKIEIPPLRNRTEDILPLANHFMRIFTVEHAKQNIHLSPQASSCLQSYAWPGNVRELKNEMERAVLLTPHGKQITPENLSERVRQSQAKSSINENGTLKEIMDRLEAMVLSRALQRHNGNRTRCAKELGISRQALIAKIQRLKVVEDT